MAIKCITQKIEEAQQRLKIQVLHQVLLNGQQNSLKNILKPINQHENPPTR